MPSNAVAAARPSTITSLDSIQRAMVLSTRRPAKKSERYQPNKWDIWMLGMAIGLGGQYFSWNDGLKGGLYTFLINYFLVGFAYIALCCCTSEITGALPFAGGAYGLSRCTLGFYAGFIIGCAEAIEYIIYVSTSVLALADMIAEINPSLSDLQPLFAVLFYCSALYFHIRGDYIFWKWNFAIGMLSLFFVVLYCVGSLKKIDFSSNADIDPNDRFVDGMVGFMTSLPLACWFFVGVEALNLASDDVVRPEITIPFAQVSCILVLFSVGIVVFFVTVSLPPQGINEIAKVTAPFNNGFHLLFNISTASATLFSIPAMYATTFGFMWGYGKLISAMATSKLLPPFLAKNHPKYGTPFNAVLFGSVVSYFICLLVCYVRVIDTYLYSICIGAAFMGYAAQCIGYISLKINYPSIKSSSFHSPFGIYGAIYSLIIWSLGIVSVIGFQDNDGVDVTTLVVIILLLTVFYFIYATSRQTLSTQEHKVFLSAHIMKFRRKKSHQFIRVHHADSTAIRLKPLRRLNSMPIKPISVPRLSFHHPHHSHKSAFVKEEDAILKLPIPKPLDDASPFHRQFCKNDLELYDLFLDDDFSGRYFNLHELFAEDNYDSVWNKDVTEEDKDDEKPIERANADDGSEGDEERSVVSGNTEKDKLQVEEVKDEDETLADAMLPGPEEATTSHLVDTVADDSDLTYDSSSQEEEQYDTEEKM